MPQDGTTDAAGTQEDSIIYTPTYYIGIVFLVLVVVSFAIEHSFHLLDKFFVKKKRKDLAEVLHRVRDELMLLGFISLLLSLCGPSISNICVTDPVGSKFLMCPFPSSEAEMSADAMAPESGAFSPPISDLQSNESQSPLPSSNSMAGKGLEESPAAPLHAVHGRGLLGFEQPLLHHLPSSLHATAGMTAAAGHSFSLLHEAQSLPRWHVAATRRLLRHHDIAAVHSAHAKTRLALHYRRILQEDSSQADYTCPAGMQPFIPLEGLHQLHLFIFIVTLMHIACSWLAVFLSLLRLRLWRNWEEAAQKACKSMTQRLLSQALRDMLDAASPASYAARQLRPLSVVLPSPSAMATSARWTPRALSERVRTTGTGLSFRTPRKPRSSRFSVTSALPKTAPDASRFKPSDEQDGVEVKIAVQEGSETSTAAAATVDVVHAVVGSIPSPPTSSSAKGGAVPTSLSLQASKSGDVARKAVRFVEVAPSKSLPLDVTKGRSTYSVPNERLVGETGEETGGVRVKVQSEGVREVCESTGRMAPSESQSSGSSSSGELVGVREDGAGVDRPQQGGRHMRQEKAGRVTEHCDLQEVVLVHGDEVDVRNRSTGGGDDDDDNECEEDCVSDSDGSEASAGEEGKARMPVRLILVLTLSSFFLQLGAVSQADYSTLRMAFIHNHRLSPTYDFHAFLLRSMRMDFLSVVGTAWYLWLYVIFTILFNIYGWNEQLWLCFVPLVMALVIGTKLKYITGKLAFDSQGMEGVDSIGQCHHQHLMRPRNSLFWFHRPQFLLSLLHFMLFMNSFCLAQITFDAIAFGLARCPAGSNFPYWQYIVQVPVSLFTQFWCSFVTLPLYALVTNMGSNPRAALFGEEVLEKLKGWRKRAQKRRAGRFKGVLKKEKRHHED